MVVPRFGDEVTLKRFVRIDTRHVELRPDSTNRALKVIRLVRSALPQSVDPGCPSLWLVDVELP